MTTTVFGADEQAEQTVDLGRWVRLAEAVLGAEGPKREAELTLLFVDEATMTDLNGRHMGGTGPTDVLAFPIDDEMLEMGRLPDNGSTGPDRPPTDLESLPMLLGDVVICPAVAARQAPDHAGDVEAELALLVVHGILHVLGHDHALEDEARLMQAKERELLGRFFTP